MPTAVSSRKRAVVAAVLVAAMISGVAGIAATACGGPRSTGTTADALDELRPLGEALVRAHRSNYTAEYATGEGMAVTVVQAPPWRAYRSMAGVYVLSPDAAYLCRASSCERAPGADAMPLSHAPAVGAALDGGFVVPEYAAAALGRAATRPGARVARASRVIAGRAADCYTVSVDRSAWTACVSSAGVLAYFDGTPDDDATDEAGDGTNDGVSTGSARIELRQFAATVAPDAFAVPASATVTDVTALG